MYPLLDLRINQQIRPPAMGTGQSWRGPEQAAYQRPLPVNLAPGIAQVRTTQVGERRLMLRLILDR